MTPPVYWLMMAQLVLIGLPLFVFNQPWVGRPQATKGWRSWAQLLFLLAIAPFPMLAFLNAALLGEQYERLLQQSHFIRSAAGFAIALGFSWLCARASFTALKRLGRIR